MPVFEPSGTDEAQAPGGQIKSPEPEPPDPQAAATALLKRALQIGLEKDDADWLHNSAVRRR